MTDNRADLHTHTTYSDGQMTPAALVEEAVWKGLCALSITDHDSIDGIEEAIRAGEEQLIEILPGIELSCEFEGREAHILGYDIEATSNLSETILTLRQRRVERMEKMLQKLAPMGVHITIDEVRNEAQNRTIGRPHLARVMLRKGYISSIGQAFARYIGDDGPANVPKERLSVPEGIALIHEAGGVAVLAHPFISRLQDDIARFCAMGLEGVEVFHPDHTPENEAMLVALCTEMGMLITGGSDYHGTGYGGRALGARFVPYEYIEPIRERARKRKGV